MTRNKAVAIDDAHALEDLDTAICNSNLSVDTRTQLLDALYTIRESLIQKHGLREEDGIDV